MPRLNSTLRWVLMLFMVGGISGSVVACDICAMFSAVTPNAQNNLVGLYFRHRAFNRWNHSLEEGFGKTQHYPSTGQVAGFSPTDDAYHSESFTSLTLHGRWFFTPQWFVQAQLPFQYNRMTTDAWQIYRVNVGDANVMVSRAILNREIKGHFWRIFGGVGLKMPTGSRYQDPSTYRELFEMQGTTGSWDVQSRLEIAWRRSSHGVMGDVSYRINTADRQQIRYGNFFNARASAFYLIDIKKGLFRLMPQGGLFLEHYAGRFWQGEALPNVGGTSLFATLGAGWFGERMNLRPEVQIPVLQDLHGDQLLSRTALTMDWSINF